MNNRLTQSGFTLIEIIIVIAIGSLILVGVLEAVAVANQSSRDAQRRNAISQTETALEQWAAAHTGSYLDTSNNVVQIDALYGNCASGGTVQYLDCGVNAPGAGSQYAPDQSPAPDTSHISITARDGTLTGPGYCIRVGLEGIGSGLVFGASDVNKSGRSMDSSTAACS